MDQVVIGLFGPTPAATPTPAIPPAAAPLPESRIVDDLRRSAWTLLVNSAAACELPPPETPLPAWWAAHRNQIVLDDPWLPELSRLGID